MQRKHWRWPIHPNLSWHRVISRAITIHSLKARASWPRWRSKSRLPRRRLWPLPQNSQHRSAAAEKAGQAVSWVAKISMKTSESLSQKSKAPIQQQHRQPKKFTNWRNFQQNKNQSFCQHLMMMTMSMMTMKMIWMNLVLLSAVFMIHSWSSSNSSSSSIKYIQWACRSHSRFKLRWLKKKMKPSLDPQGSSSRIKPWTIVGRVFARSSDFKSKTRRSAMPVVKSQDLRTRWNRREIM